VALLVVECLLWLSDRFAWLGWHKGYAVLTGVAVVGVAMLLMLVWFAIALVFRRRFQFSITSLLVFVVVVAVPCSWLAVEMRAAKRQQELVATAGRMGGQLWYDYQYSCNGLTTDAVPPGPASLQNVLGDDFFASAIGVSFMGYEVLDKKLEPLQGLSQVKTLGLRWSGITDDGLDYIKRLGQVRELDVSYNHFTDAQVNHLLGLTQLDALDVSETLITDKGLERLTALVQLQRLDLSDTDVTDDGLVQVAKLSQLQILDVSGTQVTDAGVAKLQQALPNCKITR